MNTTLKNYLEEVIKGVKPDNYESFIKSEAESLIKAKLIEKIKATPYFNYLIESSLQDGSAPQLSDEDVYDIATGPETADDLINLLHLKIGQDESGEIRGVTVLREFKEAQRDYNKARRIAERKRIDFSKCSDEEISQTATPNSFVEDNDLDNESVI